MKNNLKILSTLILRDIIPASGGGKVRLSTFLVSYLPSIGILLVLFFLCFMGLQIVDSEIRLEKRINEMKTSPYMALFCRGNLHYGEKINSIVPEKKLFKYWDNIQLKEIPDIDIKNQKLSEQKIFKKSIPFEWTQMIFKDSRSDVFSSRRGIALYFSGNKRDDELLNKISENIIGQAGLPQYDEFKIIMAKSALKLFRYDYENNIINIPAKSLSCYKPKFDFIDLKVIPAERLPYQIEYIISNKLWNILESRDLYTKVKNFRIEFEADVSNESQTNNQPDNQPDNQANKQIDKDETAVKNILSKVFSIPADNADKMEDYIDGPYGYKEKEIYITLPSKLKKLEVKKKINLAAKEIKEKQIQSLKLKEKIFYDLQASFQEEKSDVYTGAIFYLNDILFDQDTFGKDVLFKLQEYMKHYELEVGGPLLSALSESINSRKQFEQMAQLFRGGLIMTILLLFVFFYIILHIKIHRIGALRMLGINDFTILFVYFCEALIFILMAAFLAVGAHLILVSSGDFSILLSLKYWIVFSIIGASAELGILLPTVLFLLSLHPAEMLSYRQ